MRVLTTCLLALLLWSPALPVLAAIEGVSVTSGTNVTTATHTTSVTVGEANLHLVACVVTSGGVGVAVTGIARDGQNFTIVNGATASRAWEGGLHETFTQLWYLTNPSITTTNAVATAPTAGNDRTFNVYYIQYRGVDQVSPVDAFATANGSGTAVSADITTVAADAWVNDCAAGNHADGLTMVVGRTLVVDAVIGAGFTGVGVSRLGPATPGINTMGWTQTSAEWNISSVSWKPAGAGGGPTCRGALMLMGVGGC